MKIPGMGNMMKQVQKMQDDMKKMEAELETTEVTGKAGGDFVSVTVNCKPRCVSVNISDDEYEELCKDKDMFQDLIAAAVNDALRKVESTKEEKMASVTGGLNIPGMDQFLK